VGIAVLGPLAVDGDATGLGPRDRVVLAALAVRSGDVLTAEQLADALWAEDPPASWSKVVQGCVVRLRKVLGAEAIETSPQGYRLVPADDVDSQVFERLIGRCRELLTLGEPDRASYAIGEALRLWRGRPLVDLDGWDTGRIEGERLAELHLDAEELRLEAALEGGHYRDVLAEAQARVAEAPARERRWALLALAQYQAGRQDEALGTMRRVRRFLGEELGLDPGTDLLALEQSILRQDPSLMTGAALPAPSASCPYQGLVPYDVGDAEAFFGRAAEVAESLRRLSDTGVLVVVGPSGSGKSSLVRAGVTAALKRHGRQVLVITPGRRPMDALTALPETGPRPVLVVDQCEEAVALCEDAAERASFFAALAEHARRAPLVVAMRADRMGALSAHPEFARLVERGLYLLGAMGEASLRAAIQAPAHQAGLLLEAGLVDLLVREVEGEPGALPLLSHALHRTWERREGRTLTVAGYQETGGIRGAVAQSAEELYERVPAGQRPLLRDLLLRLVAPSSDGEAVRSRVPRRLVAADDEHDELVELLVDARLVTSDDGVVELAHEALARAWPRLRDWLADDTEGQRIMRHVAVAAEAWDALGRPHSELYRGARLAQALDWREQTSPSLNPTERQFLDTSGAEAADELLAAQQRAEREAAAGRRTRRLATVLAGVLVLALLAAGLAVRYQRDAAARADDAAAASTLADANRLSALSTSVGSLDLSLLLAAEAAQVADTSETRDRLLAALVEHRRAIRVVPLPGEALHLKLGDHGRRLFAAIGPRVVTWAVGSAGRATAVADWYFPGDMDASPTGDLVAIKGQRDADNRWPSVGVYTAAGEQRWMFEGDLLGTWPLDVAFAPDGRSLRLAAEASGEVSVREFDLTSGKVRTIRHGLLRESDRDNSVDAAFADDGSAVAVWTKSRHSSHRRAVVVDLVTGSRTALRLEAPSAESLGFVPLSNGAAQLWADGVVTLYDGRGRSAQVLDAHQGAVRDILIDADGGWAATGGDDGAVVLWDVNSATGLWARRESLAGHDGAVIGVELAPDGGTLVSSATDQSAIVWDVTADAGFGTALPGLGKRWISNRPDVISPGRLVVAPTRLLSRSDYGAMVPTSESADVAATFLDPRTGLVIDQVHVGLTLDGTLSGSSVAVSPDRRMVAVTYGHATAVLDTNTREVLARVELGEFVWGAGWTKDGTKLLIGAEGAEPNPYDGGLVIVDPATWREVRRVPLGGAVQVIERSPDGDVLAVANASGPSDDTTPELWILDAATFETRQTLLLGDDDFAFDLSFSPDGRWLAAAGSLGMLTVYDTSTWQAAHVPVKVHDQFAQQVEWMSDSSTVVTSGADGMVSLYDARRGQVRGVRLPGSAGQKNVSYLAQGYTYLVPPDAANEIVVLSGDRPGHRYPMDPAGWLKEACAIAGRDLTQAEWDRYLPDRAYHHTCSGQ
jgi:WD40 repeat protein/DNA-binding SARP family transcriptional activator